MLEFTGLSDTLAMLLFASVASMFLLVIILVKSRGKLEVRIKTPYGERTKKVKPESDGKTIIIQKSKKGKPEWRATFTKDSLQTKLNKRGNRTNKLYIDIFPDASKAVDYFYELSAAEKPMYDKITSQGFIEAEVLKHFGQDMKFPSPIVFYLGLMLNAVTIALLVMQMKGG